jgi:hypothetical protein
MMEKMTLHELAAAGPGSGMMVRRIVLMVLILWTPDTSDIGERIEEMIAK